MPPRLWNSRQEGTKDTSLPAAQSHHSQAPQGEQADQHEVNQEDSNHRFSFLLETIQGMQQAQFEFAKSLKVLRETQRPMPQLLHEGPHHRTQQERGSVAGNPQSGEQNAPFPQFVTLSNLTALLERERLSQPKELRHFVRRPPYPAWLLSKPYPKKYETLTFSLYDGWKGKEIEHVNKFLDYMGPFAGNGDLCLRKFSKSLTNRAYTWYSTLQSGSIATWDDMVEIFCSKYFHREEKVTILTLHNTKQKSSEGLFEFIWRFRDAALDCYGQFKEQELVEICIDNMSHEYRGHLENLHIIQFAQLLHKARKTAVSVQPFTAERPKPKKKNAPQALTVSTNEPIVREKRKREEEEKYPPIPYTDEEMNAIIAKWMVDGVLRPFKPIREPT